jgi:hypothetical protein
MVMLRARILTLESEYRLDVVYRNRASGHRRDIANNLPIQLLTRIQDMNTPLAAALLLLFGSTPQDSRIIQEPAPGFDPAVVLPAPEGIPASWTALLNGVDESRLGKAVHTLCDFGPRMGGTASGNASAAWLKKQFDEVGAPAIIRKDRETWCHSEESWSVRISYGEGPAAKSFDLKRAWPYGFSPTASGTASLSLEIKEGGALLAKRTPRVRSGAVVPVLALVDGSVTIDGEYARVHHLRSGDKNQFPVFGLNKPEGKRIRALLDAGQTLQVDYAIESTIKLAKPRTVVATIPARKDAPKGFLLYCAHGDSDAGGPGADDNASGDAVVLEIARSWAAAIKSGAIEAPPRELRFAVWGKEIHSTRDYLQSLDPELDGPLLGVINYDQAGFGSGADQFNIEPDDLPANQTMIRAILSVLDTYSGRGGMPARYATNKSLGGTDSYVFSSAKLFKEGERPSLTLFTSAWDHPDEQKRTKGQRGESWNDRDKVTIDYDNYYHSAGDTPENTTDKEPWNMGWCARVGLVGGLVWLESLAAPD